MHAAKDSPAAQSLRPLVSVVALLWVIFQLWVSSPLQYWLAAKVNFVILNDLQVRVAHLCFGLSLLFLVFPVFTSRTRSYWNAILAFLVIIPVLYPAIYYGEMANRAGNNTSFETFMSVIGIAALVASSWRVVGTGFAIFLLVFIIYALYGEIMPDLIAHKNAPLDFAANYLWMSSEGVFGIALGVSAGFVFLYVLFGSLLDKAGAGNFFIRLSFVLLEKFTGGPAKAAVLASGLMGMVSGSSVANTMTVGTFTIPLMRKMGLSAEKSGAVEVSAGINGQIMPPLMGAAAFLISEFLAIPYSEIVRRSFLPAIAIYATLLLIVHLEVKKLSLAERKEGGGWLSLLFILLSTCLAVIFCGAIYFVIEGVGGIGLKHIFGRAAFPLIVMLVVAVYVLLLRYKATGLDVESMPFNATVKIWDILRSGFPHFIPVFILVWCLMVEKLSPALAAYWSVLFLVFMVLCQRPIIAFFKGDNRIRDYLSLGWQDLKSAGVSCSKSMITIAIATAASGIIVGAVSLTGIGLSISGIIDHIADGSIITALVLTGAICIVLGMGIPTTACYVIVSTLMAPVLVYVSRKNGIYVEPLSIHLFVLYFGLMADVTPPVGLATYAAAAISGGDPIKTGFYAFFYNMRTMIFPFLFFFDNRILLYGIDNQLAFIGSLIIYGCGVVVLSYGMQGYFLIRSKWYESLIVVMAGLLIIAPGYWMDKIVAPYQMQGVGEYSDYLSEASLNKKLQIKLEGLGATGEDENRLLYVPIENFVAAKDPVVYLSKFGLETKQSMHDYLKVLNIDKGNPMMRGIDSTYNVVGVGVPTEQPSKYIMFIVSLVLLGKIFLLQRARKKNV